MKDNKQPGVQPSRLSPCFDIMAEADISMSDFIAHKQVAHAVSTHRIRKTSQPCQSASCVITQGDFTAS